MMVSMSEQRKSIIK